MKNLIDPLTNEIFVPLRKNMRFAKPQNRIKWHAQKLKREKHLRAFIDSPLQVNHKILMELSIEPNDTIVISKEVLSKKGYNFSIMSHYERHNELIYPALYNFILLTFGSNEATVCIKRIH